MKDFHNVFAYFGRSKPKKNLNAKKTHFKSSYNVIKYICAKKKCHNILKCKYIQKMIKMIFNFM